MSNISYTKKHNVVVNMMFAVNIMLTANIRAKKQQLFFSIPNPTIYLLSTSLTTYYVRGYRTIEIRKYKKSIIYLLIKFKTSRY